MTPIEHLTLHALRTAQELLAFMRHNVGSTRNAADANIELIATSAHGERLAALLCEASRAVPLAIECMEGSHNTLSCRVTAADLIEKCRR